MKMATVKFEIPRPTVPSYLASRETDIHKEAAPGHKFLLYFTTSTITGTVECDERDKDTKRYLEQISEEGNLGALEKYGINNRNDWDKLNTKKSKALKQTLSVPTTSSDQIKALRRRQQALVALAAVDAKLSLEAEAMSSLATGMGMEHPLENGFAFLNPYGLPYLPGSSIKGVLRRAAEELAQDSKDGWNSTAIDVLLGHEDSNNASRGALTFWDAIPEVAGNTMGMDVMTPHYGDYYQGNATPHDAGSPNPIVFMVIPAKSKFTFHVTADTQRLKGMENWQALMQTAFDHAFKWLGFGAKTAVGYGAMRHDEEAEQRASAELEKLKAREVEAKRRAEEAALPVEQRKLRDLAALLDKDKQANLKQAGTQTSNDLAALLREATKWEKEYRLKLAALAEEIYGWHGWGPKKKIEDKKAVLVELRS